MIKFREPDLIQRGKQHHFVMRSINAEPMVICDYNIGSDELRIAGSVIGFHPDFTNVRSFIDWCSRYVNKELDIKEKTEEETTINNE